MDGKGRWMDSVFIERLWWLMKYECVYLHAFENGSEARAGIGKWMTYYNGQRPHSALGGRTSLEAHAGDERRAHRTGGLGCGLILLQARCG